jgi:arylsulfatase
MQCLLLLLTFALALCLEALAARPNILFILTDDQGYGDLGAHGNPVLKTPHLDRLHAESARFNDFRVSPTCSPTRAALLTGRHEFKSGVTHTIRERERLSLKATTISQVLRDAGYTTAIFGKWHLGDEPERWPSRRGFDETFVHGAGGIGQAYPGTCADAPGNSYFDPVILHNGRFEKTRGFCTDVFFAEATKWIESAKSGGKPFFAWIATNAPHAPLHCPPEWSRPYEGTVPADTAKFFGMIANIDDNVGKLMARLHEWGIDRDTLVVFMTDNGTASGAKVWNAKMAGQKGSTDNGGTRAISFWRWPAEFAPGDRPQLAAHIDVFPTLAEIAGAKIPESAKVALDGFSLAPLLRDPAAKWHDDRLLFTHVGRWELGRPPAKYGASPSVRWRNFLVIRRGANWAVFDLAADPGEKSDLAASHPELVARIDRAYDAWWEEVLPCLENEDAFRTAPETPPLHALYREQFGK